MQCPLILKRLAWGLAEVSSTTVGGAGRLAHTRGSYSIATAGRERQDCRRAMPAGRDRKGM